MPTKKQSSISVTANFGVIIPAAGSGKRFGGGDKLRKNIGSLKSPPSVKTVLQHAVHLFAQRRDVSVIVIVTAPDRFAIYGRDLKPVIAFANQKRKRNPLTLRFVPGGRERWESVLFGLRELSSLEPNLVPDYVAVHDAARPLTHATVIDAAFDGAIKHGGSVPCLPEPATLKRAQRIHKNDPQSDLLVTQTVDRSELFQAQTPQCFRRDLLIAAYEKLLKRNQLTGVTDDAQVFSLVGYPVAATLGIASNVKITTAADIKLARALLKMGMK